MPLPQALSRPDQILPIFVVSELTNGLAGFIVAAIVAAALSPSLNAMAATTVSDFYLPYINPSADQATQMRVSKQATVAWGVVQLAVAHRRAVHEPVGARCRPGRAVVRVGSGARRVPARHARAVGPRARHVCGMIAGLIVMTAVWWATPIAFTWYVLIGAVTTCVVAFVSRAAHRRRSRMSRIDRCRGDRRRSCSSAIADRVFPGAVVEVGRANGPHRHATPPERSPTTPDRTPVGAHTIYDLASLTKVIGTAALMAGEVAARPHAAQRSRPALDCMRGPAKSARP